MHIVFQHARPLPVPKYGGIERLIVWLMKDLARLGHKVTLLGHPDSKLSDFGVHTIPASEENWKTLIPKDADLIHLFFPYNDSLPLPHICYVAGNAKPNEELPLNSVFSSRSHATIHASECFIHHGVDFLDYPLEQRLSRDDAWSRFSFLAKSSWKIKNLSDCLRATKAARKHLYIGGGWKFSLSPRVHWLGMLNDQESCDLYDRTDAFLWPVLWPEPFGLAPVVAMSRGLPVIASQHGSSPELIQTPSVGVLCKNYDEFAGAIASRPNFYAAKEIRDYALSTFPIRKMTLAFLDKYDTILQGQSLNSRRPEFQMKVPADKVLLSF